MNYEEAMDILKAKLTDIQVLNYREYKGAYVFQTAPADLFVTPFEPIIGGYYSVNKLTGAVNSFNPKFEKRFFDEEEHDLTGFAELLDSLGI